MRLYPKLALRACLVLASISALSTASSSPSITLSQFQQISGFSTSCTNAYNTPIAGCTSNDFANNNPCSSSCIRGLQTITALLNTNCQGTEANPKTLIGLFFQGQGVIALCPNAGNSGGSQSVYSGSSAVVASTSAVSTSPVSTSPLSTSSTASSVTRTSPSTSTVAASGSSAGPTQNAATSTSASSTTRAGSDLTKTVLNQGSATVLTSKADQTASTNPDAFGGGGSPFEISRGTHTGVDLLWALYCTGICMFATWVI